MPVFKSKLTGDTQRIVDPDHVEAFYMPGTDIKNGFAVEGETVWELTPEYKEKLDKFVKAAESKGSNFTTTEGKTSREGVRMWARSIMSEEQRLADEAESDYAVELEEKKIKDNIEKNNREAEIKVQAEIAARERLENAKKSVKVVEQTNSKKEK